MSSQNLLIYGKCKDDYGRSPLVSEDVMVGYPTIALVHAIMYLLKTKKKKN
jgi:hypothetical protein